MPPTQRSRRPNRVRQFRESLYLLPEEFAELAGVSTRTLWSVESGYSCRLATRRSSLNALGVAREEAGLVFPADTPRRPSAPEIDSPGI